MLDPLTAISLASSVVQFVEFGVKIVSGSIELYHSKDGVDSEVTNFEFEATRVHRLADKIKSIVDHRQDGANLSEDEIELQGLAERCRVLASDLVSVLDGLKVKRLGRGRKWESVRKSVEAQMPWNKDKIGSLEKQLRVVQQAIMDRIQWMMRYSYLTLWR